MYYGCSYEGRREGSRFLIGSDMKIPIVIEEKRNIIFSSLMNFFDSISLTNDVAFKTIMDYCQSNGIGWMAWSWSGNSDGILDLTSPKTFLKMI